MSGKQIAVILIGLLELVFFAATAVGMFVWMINEVIDKAKIPIIIGEICILTLPVWHVIDIIIRFCYACAPSLTKPRQIYLIISLIITSIEASCAFTSAISLLVYNNVIQSTPAFNPLFPFIGIASALIVYGAYFAMTFIELSIFQSDKIQYAYLPLQTLPKTEPETSEYPILSQSNEEKGAEIQQNPQQFYMHIPIAN